MNTARLTSLLLLLVGALTAPMAAHSGEALATVKARGLLRCGVSEGIPGFSQRDANGRWQGLDADFCRAVAAAVVGDADRVEFVPLRSSTRFPALQSRRVDLLRHLCQGGGAGDLICASSATDCRSRWCNSSWGRSTSSP